MTANGGKLLLDYYDDYAYHLNDFVQYMDGQGVAIDVVSVQNEPDWHPDYDSCDWTGNELRNFVRDHGGKIQNTKLLVGESLRFNRDYTDPTLLDAAAAANIDYVGGHLYSAESTGYFTRYPLAEEKGKGRWMTEWLSHEADGDGAVNDVVLAIPQPIEAAQFHYTSRFRNREPMDVNYDGQKAAVDVGARSISTIVLEY